MVCPLDIEILGKKNLAKKCPKSGISKFLVILFFFCYLALCIISLFFLFSSIFGSDFLLVIFYFYSVFRMATPNLNRFRELCLKRGRFLNLHIFHNNVNVTELFQISFMFHNWWSIRRCNFPTSSWINKAVFRVPLRILGFIQDIRYKIY